MGIEQLSAMSDDKSIFIQIYNNLYQQDNQHIVELVGYCWTDETYQINFTSVLLKE